MINISIIDGYIDEPTCLGVPPYISPYPRYIAGAIWDFDKNTNVKYFTIDQIRKNSKIINFLTKDDIIIIIAGMSVPGRYLSGFPASPNEIKNLMSNLSKPIKILSFSIKSPNLTVLNKILSVFNFFCPNNYKIIS